MATNDALNNPLSGNNGTGQYVGDTSPSLTTPDIGVATGTSLNLGSSTTIDGFLDEDDMSSDSATDGATQQSIKAYVDGNINRKNLIIGGNFSTNPWQRGTSFTSPASSDYNADRFSPIYVTSGLVTITKDSSAPTPSECGLVTSCKKTQVTTADASIAAGDYYADDYRMEGYDFSQIAQQDFTLSFWVRSNKTGTYCISIRNSGSDRSYISEYTINDSATWEKKSITIPASPSAGTWDYTNGVGARISFTYMCGSTFHTTADAWQTGAYLATSSQVNLLDNTSNYFEVALVQVEKGDTATPFEIRHEQTELALCQRYYQKSFPQGTAPVQAVGTTSPSVVYRTALAGANVQSVNITYPVVMRTSPNITTYNPIASNALWHSITRAADSGAAVALSSGASMLTIQNAQNALDGATDLLSIHYTASAEL